VQDTSTKENAHKVNGKHTSNSTVEKHVDFAKSPEVVVVVPCQLEDRSHLHHKHLNQHQVNIVLLSCPYDTIV